MCSWCNKQADIAADNRELEYGEERAWSQQVDLATDISRLDSEEG